MPHKRKARFQCKPKQVSRRVQLSSISSNACIKNDSGLPMKNPVSPASSPTREISPPSTASNKFAVPQINTMVRTQAELESVQQMRVEVKSKLSPRSKAAIAPKAVKKLNIPANRTVFRDLIPINVNDSLREMERPRISKTNESTKLVSAEPSLANYVEKIDHVQLVMPEPELVMDFPPGEFDFLNAYRKCYRYN